MQLLRETVRASERFDSCSKRWNPEIFLLFKMQEKHADEAQKSKVDF